MAFGRLGRVSLTELHRRDCRTLGLCRRFWGALMRDINTGSIGLVGSAASALGIWLSLAAQAQSAVTTADASSDALAEIIVTAEKRSEDVQKTPIAITTISGEDIARRAENQLDTTLRNVPSVQVQSTPQGGEIYIRGVGANGDSNYVDPSVALSFDGVYSGRSERLAAALYDINHIEVLRGPQGTIYGRDADGGAVNVISNGPVIGSSESRINLQLGNFDLAHVDAAQNIGVNDQLAFRIAAEREDRHGYFTNDAYASHVSAFRVKGLYLPTEDLSIQLLLDYSHQSGHWATTVSAPGPFAGPPSFVFNSNSDFCAGASGGWLDAQPNNPWYVDPCHPADTIDYKFETVAFQVDYRTSWATLTVIPSYTHDTRSDLTNLVVGDDPFFAGALLRTRDGEDQKTGELRLTSPDSSRVKWVVGYYYLWTNDGGTFSGTTPQSATVGGATVTLFNTTDLDAPATTSRAPFGQITYPVTDAFRITGGLRYTQDSKSESVNVVSVAVPGYNSGTETATLKNSATTYKAGVEFDAAKESMLYAQLSTGYKAGGFATTGVPPASYRPEHVKAYEIGSKNRFLDGTLQINADVYYYQYTDLQVQYSTSLTSSLPIPPQYVPAGAVYSYFQQYIANAGAGVNKGAELELRYRFTPTDEVDLTGAYINAHYGNFSQPQLSGLNGERIAATPENTGVLNYQHDWLLGGAKLSAQVDSKISSSYFASVNNRAVNTYGFQKGYTRVSAWVKNIEDKAQYQYGDFPLSRVIVNFPRTYGLSLSLKF
jgi:iron complex outermembrane receptor protein